MIARRNAKRRNWPTHLYEPRPGYYVYRDPDGKTYALGAIPLAHAVHQAMQANAHFLAQEPSLIERIEGADHTISDVLDKMPAGKAANTRKTYRFLDGIIRAELGDTPCYSLTVAKCATFLESHMDKPRSAQSLRTRLSQVCREAQHLGWIDSNPAQVTRAPKVDVMRQRLTMDTFHAIYAAAPKVSAWLQRAMLIGLVLGADRITIAGLTRSNVADGLLTYRRQKTGCWIAVPLSIRMDAVGVSLADLVNAKTAVLSPYLLCHTHRQGRAAPGDPIHPDTISQAFTDAVAAAGIAGEHCPTFHELRSLCKREYLKQGNVDTKALLGHAGERVADKYADPRGIEPVRVKVG